MKLKEYDSVTELSVDFNKLVQWLSHSPLDGEDTNDIMSEWLKSHRVKGEQPPF